jgi:hypothetical protein
MAVPIRANNNVVITAWLQGIAGLDPTMIGNTVPDKSKWVNKGFLRHRVVGGSRHNYQPVFQPVVQLDCYACSGTEGNYKPSWNQANAMAELIHDAAKDEEVLRRTLTLPTGYPETVQMMEVHTGGEPQPLDSDDGDVARFRMDFRFIWAVMF